MNLTNSPVAMQQLQDTVAHQAQEANMYVMLQDLTKALTAAYSSLNTIKLWCEEVDATLAEHHYSLDMIDKRLTAIENQLDNALTPDTTGEHHGCK